MDVAAFNRVVQPALDRPVIDDPAVHQERVVQEERLHDELLRPANPVAHRPDDDVLADAHRDIPREEEVRQRRKGVAGRVQRPRQRARGFLAPLDQHPNDLLGRKLLDLAGQGLGRNDVHRLANQQLTHLGAGQHMPSPRR
jgi:hypothetical protein